MRPQQQVRSSGRSRGRNRRWPGLALSSGSGGLDQQGSVTVLMAGVIVVAGMVMWWSGVLGGVMVRRSQAQTAADAAALAGAVHGQSEAETMAVANGAQLLAFTATVVGSEVSVDVEVSVDGISAQASARYVPPPPPPPPPVESTVPTESTLAPSASGAVAPAVMRDGEQGG